MGKLKLLLGVSILFGFLISFAILHPCRKRFGHFQDEDRRIRLADLFGVLICLQIVFGLTAGLTPVLSMESDMAIGVSIAIVLGVATVSYFGIRILNQAQVDSSAKRIIFIGIAFPLTLLVAFGAAPILLGPEVWPRRFSVPVLVSAIPALHLASRWIFHKRFRRDEW